MRSSNEESSPRTSQAMDLISEVKELHRLNPQELSKLLKENENFILLPITENGSTLEIHVEKLLRLLPLHLTAVLLSSQRDEVSLRYLLSGLRLVHSFCEIASRHSKLEQILLDDVRVSAQLLDLVFYILVLCSSCKQGYRTSAPMAHLLSALVACSMYLLTACISSHWNELACVLQAHPKVDVFVDAAFGAVRRNINFLQTMLSDEENVPHSNPIQAVERTIYFCCQQCEAAVQFLQQICQNKSFRERLFKNKELCGKGGVVRLVHAALKLNATPIFKDSLAVVAAVSRLKARVLSILLLLCETESVSYLDEVASIPESLDLTKSVAIEVFAVLKTMLSGDLKLLERHSGQTYPLGLLQLNALRLADIFTDDSNFRSYITEYFTEVLVAILSIPYQQFLSSWCSSELPFKEEDASLDYEPLIAAGWILDLSSPSEKLNAEIYESNFILTNSAQTAYAHQRTSLLVKIIANLHCFVPNVCKEQERNLFLCKFLGRLKIYVQDSQGFALQPCAFSSVPQKAAAVYKNLRLLLGHAESLIPSFLNEEDVQLLRVFFTQFQQFAGPLDAEVKELEMQKTRGYSSPLHITAELDQNIRNSQLREGISENSAFPGVDNPCIEVESVSGPDGTMHDDNIVEDKYFEALPERLRKTEKEVQNAETSGSDSSTTRENLVDAKSNEHSCKNIVEGIQEDGRVDSINGEEKQIRKRKRNIMNNEQICMIERALLDEPDMQRNSASVKAWAERLSSHGAEITSSQLKNWINNRKAKRSRAAKDRQSSEENPIGHKQDDLIMLPSSEAPNYHTDSLAPADDQNKSAVVKTCSGADTISQITETAFPDSSPRLNFQNDSPGSNAICLSLEVGQAVVLADTEGKEIAKGRVLQVDGQWQNCCLAGTNTCVVDITELKPDRIVKLPAPSPEAGATFEQAEIKVGNMRVLWDLNRIRLA